MFHVNSRPVIKETARLIYKAEKKRNLLFICALAASAFLTAMTCTIGISYWNSLTQMQLRLQGIDCSLELKAPDSSQIKAVRSLDSVKYAGVYVSCGVLMQYRDKPLDGASLFWADQTCWKKQILPALESCTGYYPKKKGELMASIPLLRAMGLSDYKIGMKLPLSYDTSAESPDGRLVKKKFVLCGWYEDYTQDAKALVSKSFFEKSGVKTDSASGSLKIKLKNPLSENRAVIQIRKEAGLLEHQSLKADHFIVPNFCQTIVVLSGLLIMVFLSAFLFIYNTMYISICRNIRFYGQLKTIGMTSLQLKELVYRQAAYNCISALPPALFCAWLLSRSVVPDILPLINSGFDGGYLKIVPAQPWVFVLSGVFMLFTVFISCREPAKKAGNCPPIEAMHCQLQYVRTARQRPRRKENLSLSAMALQNLLRCRKQTAVVLFSFVLSLSIFITADTAITAENPVSVLHTLSSYDIQFVNIHMLKEKKQRLTRETAEQILKIPGVSSVQKVSSAPAVIPYQEETFGAYYRALYESKYSPGTHYRQDMAAYKKNPADSRFGARFIGIGREMFEEINKSLGSTLDWDAFEKGRFAIINESAFVPGDFGIPGKTIRFFLPDGLSPDTEYRIPVAACVKSGLHPEYLGGGYTPNLIVSEAYAQKLMGKTLTELINVTYKKSFSASTEKAVKAVFKNKKKISYTYSKLEKYGKMKQSESQAKVLGYTVSILMALLALLNDINLSAAGIQNRAKEFASLESIGMTAGQIKKMLFWEGAFCGILSIAAALPAGLILCHFSIDSLRRFGTGTPYAVPWLHLLALSAAVLILCMTVPGIIYSHTQKATIIERLYKGDE